jgi:hypothetical protein
MKSPFIGKLQGSVNSLLISVFSVTQDADYPGENSDVEPA